MAKNRNSRTRYQSLNARIVKCDRCPRLIEHCRTVAIEKRAAYRDDVYHGKPVPNFGPSEGRLLVVGLAPGAHGANRTGRMFTGDRSGDFLYEAMHAAGFANQPTSVDAADGLELIDAVITATAHCAPPGNKPTRDELQHCEPFLEATIAAMERVRAMLCLGKIAHDAVLRLYKSHGLIASMAAYPFAHGSEHAIGGDETPKQTSPSNRKSKSTATAKTLPETVLIGCYHPSQQNTFTGKLTKPMLTRVFKRAATIIRRS